MILMKTYLNKFNQQNKLQFQLFDDGNANICERFRLELFASEMIGHRNILDEIEIFVAWATSEPVKGTLVNS